MKSAWQFICKLRVSSGTFSSGLDGNGRSSGEPDDQPHLDPPEIANKLGMRGSWRSVIDEVDRRIRRNIMDESPVRTSPGGLKVGRNPKPKSRRKDNPSRLSPSSAHTLVSVIAFNQMVFSIRRNSQCSAQVVPGTLNCISSTPVFRRDKSLS